MKKPPDSDRAPHFSAYTLYGYAINAPEEQCFLAFNGQLRDALTGLYALGNGHRSYNPVLQRFQSADMLSPFDTGGINAYAYCGGDPINRTDPSGRSWMSLFKGIANLFGRKRGRDRVPVPQRAPTAQALHSARLEGTIPPSYDQANSENLLLPSYQLVEDKLLPRQQQRLGEIRERRRIIYADIKTLKYRPDEVPELMRSELAKLANRSLRLRSRSASDLTQPISFSPHYSTAIIEAAPPSQPNRQIRRS
ncbi:RHS repeat-associated core domain-containing protein [Pseudomonas sp. NBRC 111132]|uniref:RHS repeat-associated core domain-containing protein n=1 Tax=Pseudomonas sp. NBRC 111132 TaxID=1661047 RepID=UPI0009EBB3A0